MKTIESDICILGAGISGVLVADRLLRARPELRVTLVEAGRRFFDSEKRQMRRERYLQYGENPWPHDYVESQLALNAYSQTMAVGGWALHWSGECPRASKEELKLKSLYGVAVDWPMEWPELEKYYCEAERAIGVSGEPSPYPEDQRSEPYPMPPLPLNYSLAQIKRWAEKSGLRLNVEPTARNSVPYGGRGSCLRCDTCTPICPTGARFSPDHILVGLLEKKRVELFDRVLVRRLHLKADSNQVESADGFGVDSDAHFRFKAKRFILALGKHWTPHLLLLSANSRYPMGLGNSSGMVGKNFSGWGRIKAALKIEQPVYAGIHDTVFLESREFYRCPVNQPYLRHSTFFSTSLPQPRLINSGGSVQVGDELLEHWRSDSRNRIEVKIRFDLHSDGESGITLDRETRNRWGDPMPKLTINLSDSTKSRIPRVNKHFSDLLDRMRRAGGGELVSLASFPIADDDPLGGCRMSSSPRDGVCDSYGRTFDHDNLFIVGAPTLPTAGLSGNTLLLSAVSLRTADEMIRTS